LASWGLSGRLLKLIEDLAADDHARARLIREAQHASALNHPNICTIHEIGEWTDNPSSLWSVSRDDLNKLIPQDGLLNTRA
jgi:hypothetical protein